MRPLSLAREVKLEDINPGVIVPLVIIANIFIAAILVTTTVGLLGSAIWTPRRPQSPARVTASSVHESHHRDAGFGARTALEPQA